jgi:hypothetical protein
MARQRQMALCPTRRARNITLFLKRRMRGATVWESRGKWKLGSKALRGARRSRFFGPRTARTPRTTGHSDCNIVARSARKPLRGRFAPFVPFVLFVDYLTAFGHRQNARSSWP